MEVDILALALQRLSVDGGITAEFLSHCRLPTLLKQVAGTPASNKKVRRGSALKRGAVQERRCVCLSAAQDCGGNAKQMPRPSHRSLERWLSS